MSGDALNVKNLSVVYRTEAGPVHPVTNVSFNLRPGESLGLVGESGCGKTTVAMALLRLLPDNGEIVSGSIDMGGVDIVELEGAELEDIRWRRISMVFQAAMNSLNPVHKVRDQIIEAIDAHETVPRAEAEERTRRLFDLVGLDEQLLERYPHEYSGGMRQRAVIAMALACNPEIVIADEPTTALDVIVQDRILKELQSIQDQKEMAMIYISHDVAVIAEVSDTIAVMYAGQFVEKGPSDVVFARPIHPYTDALLASVPSVRGERKELRFLAGEPPSLSDIPASCPFAPRCSRALPVCDAEIPPLIGDDTHWAACHNPVEAILS